MIGNHLLEVAIGGGDHANVDGRLLGAANRTDTPFLKDTESRVRFNWRFDRPDKYQEMVRGYFRMISGVDRVIVEWPSGKAEDFRN